MSLIEVLTNSTLELESRILMEKYRAQRIKSCFVYLITNSNKIHDKELMLKYFSNFNFVKYQNNYLHNNFSYRCVTWEINGAKLEYRCMRDNRVGIDSEKQIDGLELLPAPTVRCTHR